MELPHKLSSEYFLAFGHRIIILLTHYFYIQPGKQSSKPKALGLPVTYVTFLSLTSLLIIWFPSLVAWLRFVGCFSPHSHSNRVDQAVQVPGRPRAFLSVFLHPIIGLLEQCRINMVEPHPPQGFLPEKSPGFFRRQVSFALPKSCIR